MTTSRISVKISRTINLGNFNSLKVEAGLEEAMPPDTTYSEAYKHLWNTVNLEVNRAIAAFDKSKETK